MRTIAVTEMDCPGSMLESLFDDRKRINKSQWWANAQIWRRHLPGHGPRYALVREVHLNDLKPGGDDGGMFYWPSIDVAEYMDRGWTVIA